MLWNQTTSRVGDTIPGQEGAGCQYFSPSAETQTQRNDGKYPKKHQHQLHMRWDERWEENGRQVRMGGGGMRGNDTPPKEVKHDDWMDKKPNKNTTTTTTTKHTVAGLKGHVTVKRRISQICKITAPVAIYTFESGGFCPQGFHMCLPRPYVGVPVP